MPSSFPPQRRSTDSKEEDDSKDGHEGQSWSPRSPARGMLELFRRPLTGGNTRHDFAPCFVICTICCLLLTPGPSLNSDCWVMAAKTEQGNRYDFIDISLFNVIVQILNSINQEL